MTLWPVVPICDLQKRDVKPSDLINGGLYRVCNVSHAGGGCDPLPQMLRKKYGFDAESKYDRQFVVQLQGCPLNCWYCYVTPDGVHGDAKQVLTEEIIIAFVLTDCNVFHLMGGAPGCYFNDWPDILQGLRQGAVFHSDLLLIECDYNPDVLERLCVNQDIMIAVNIKGTSEKEWLKNTRTEFTPELECRFWDNLGKILMCPDPERFYFTFTNCDHHGVELFKVAVKTKFYRVPFIRHLMKNHCFEFPIRHYKALEK